MREVRPCATHTADLLSVVNSHILRLRSVDGTHLGHNIPDSKGANRYCINLVSVAGNPSK